MERLSKLRGWVKDPGDKHRKEIPDPAYMAAFLRKAEAAGKEPVALARVELERAEAGLDEDENTDTPQGQTEGSSSPATTTGSVPGTAEKEKGNIS
jgi:hypothetical protein